MKALVRKITTLASVHFAEMVEFRGELFFWMIATSLPLIMMGLWVPAARSGRFDLTADEMARYFLVLFVVRQMTIVWVIYHFEWHVVTGRLSPLLLQPFNPMVRFFIAHLSEQAARVPLVILVALAVGWMLPGAINTLDGHGARTWWLPSPVNVGKAVLVTYGAFVLRYLIQACFSMLAFWVERATAIEAVFYIPYLYMSGLIAPLEAYDEPVRRVILWTPFPYLLWFPANLLIGRETVPLWQGLAVIAGWSAAFLGLARWMWRRGLRNYSAMGA